MRVPQVSERIKEAPAQALRGVFAGIGQLLLYTDKLRNKAPFGQHGPYARAPGEAQPATPSTEPAESVPDVTAASAPADRDAAAEPAAPQAPEAARASRAPQTPAAPETPKPPAAKPTAAKPPAAKPPAAANEIRDFDKTGNVRLITADQARADDEPPAAAPLTEAAAAQAVRATAAEKQAPASAAEPAGGAGDCVPPLPNYDELSIASLRARLRNLDVAQVRELAEYEKAHAARADVIVMFERRVAKLEADD
ncbi:MAG TPA: hypothetical protein VME19_21910 [Streptosporangiaceae bacterium]|nr:hypothetical protein [Streptosporangiaceae bacterium]